MLMISLDYYSFITQPIKPGDSVYLASVFGTNIIYL